MQLNLFKEMTFFFVVTNSTFLFCLYHSHTNSNLANDTILPIEMTMDMNIHEQKNLVFIFPSHGPDYNHSLKCPPPPFLYCLLMPQDIDEFLLSV
jgi:hypothetical protein